MINSGDRVGLHIVTGILLPAVRHLYCCLSVQCTQDCMFGEQPSRSLDCCDLERGHTCRPGFSLKALSCAAARALPSWEPALLLLFPPTFWVPIPAFSCTSHHRCS